MKILRAIGVFITTALIYLGIPLAGWGILKIGSFFGTYHYSGYAVLVFTFSLLVGIQAFTSLEGIQDGPGAEGIKVHRQSIIGSLLIGTLAVALFIIPFLSRHGIGVFGQLQIISWFGVALCGFGYLLIYWSGLALGKQYSAEVTLQKDHKLITTGALIASSVIPATRGFLASDWGSRYYFNPGSDCFFYLGSWL